MRPSISQVIFTVICLIGWLCYFSIQTAGDGYALIGTVLILLTEMPWVLVALLFQPDIKVGSLMFFISSVASQSFNFYLLRKKKKPGGNGNNPP